MLFRKIAMLFNTNRILQSKFLTMIWYLY